MFAFDHGHGRIARYLLEKGANVDPVNQVGNTLLVLVVRHCDTALAELLLEFGANFQAIIVERDSSVLAYTIVNGIIDVMRPLLCYGANTKETKILENEVASALLVASFLLKPN